MYLDILELISHYWKVLLGALLGSFLVSLLLAFFLMPTERKVYVTFEPGRAYTEESRGESVLLDNPVALAARIETGAYDDRVIRALSMPVQTELDWKVLHPRDTGLIDVSIFCVVVEQCKRALETLLSEIVIDLKARADAWRSIHHIEIERLNQTIVLLNRQKEIIRRKVAIVEKELGSIAKNLDTIQQQQVARLAAPAETETKTNEASLLYSVVVQQTLHDQLDFTTKIQGLNIEIAKLDEEMSQKEADKKNEQQMLDSIAEIEVFGGVQIAHESTRPNKLAVISAVTILGLLFSLLGILLIEARKQGQKAVSDKPRGPLPSQ